MNIDILLKGDLHIHTNEDPQDRKVIPYNNLELVDYLDTLGFDFFSITLHNHIMPEEKQKEVKKYSKSKGMIYINNGVEKSVEKAHVLIYGLDEQDLKKIKDLESLREIKKTYGLKQKNLLIGASHPHFPSKTCINEKLGQHHRLFHFVEYNSFYIDFVNFNNHLIPEEDRFYPIQTIIGNSDAHSFDRINHTYTLLYIPNIYFNFKSKNKKEKPINPETKKRFKELVKSCSDEEYEKVKNTLIDIIKKESPYQPRFVEVKTQPLPKKQFFGTIYNMFLRKTKKNY